MTYNLTDNQQKIARWFVEQVRAGYLPEEFRVVWELDSRSRILDFSGSKGDTPEFTSGILEALASANLILNKPSQVMLGPGSPVIKYHDCALLGNLFKAVDTNFAAPDTSFAKHLIPLTDITYLDSELKERCLPTLAADGTDSKLWDAALRTALVILETRLRDVGGITDGNRVGQDLVNSLFAEKGTLAHKFLIPAERQGYRDLFAGVVGALRNPYNHRLIDPTPETGGAIMVFVDFLLKTLENLR